MKLAVLSDIHGNLPAFEEVLAHVTGWSPDIVVINGDIVNRGPKPHICWKLAMQQVQQRGWLITRGNHEEYTMAWQRPREWTDEIDRRIVQSSHWTFRQLDDESIAQMQRLPLSVTINHPEGGQIRITHASMLGTSDGIGPWTTDEELAQKIAPAPDIFVTSHTHRFFTRGLNGTLIVNSGSVGTPLDGDWRCGYAQIVWNEGWHVNLIRLAYDREQMRRDYEAATFFAEGGHTTRIMYREWLDAQSYFPTWDRRYMPRIRQGELDLDEALNSFLTTI